MLWMAVFQYPMMTIIQEICARIGLVTGNGLGGVLKNKYKNFRNPRNFGTDDSIHKRSIVIRYLCIVCGHYHNEKSCPICGSKMKKVDF
jgi:hypothetical protein